jgi:inhibitor of cysteine peptidase
MAKLTLTEAEHGRRFTVAVGDTITISLSESSAAGYRWTPASLGETLLTWSDPEYQPTSEAVGSAGTAIWKLTATRPGRTRIELVKARPWEQDRSKRERFRVDLDIVT